jgi:uncharacterized protein YyaL (SSP411 family)
VLGTCDKEVYDYVTKQFLPESIIALVENQSQLADLSKYPFFAGKVLTDKTVVYVCKNFSCSLPLSKISEIAPLL